MRFMTFREFCSMLYFLQNRMHLAIATLSVYPQVDPDWWKYGNEIEKIISLHQMMSCSRLAPSPTTLNSEHQNEYAISLYTEAKQGKDYLTTDKIFSDTNMSNFDLIMPQDDVCFSILSILAQSPTICKTQGLSVIYIICKCLAGM